MQVEKGFMVERKKHIIECALRNFCEGGIGDTTISKVAKSANVGEATIYRYFSGKRDLIMSAARAIWEKAEQTLDERLEIERFDQKNGHDQIAIILNAFSNTYKFKRNFFKFIFDFGDYILKQDDECDKLDLHDMPEVRFFIDYLIKAVEKGYEDGSVEELAPAADVCWSLVNMFASLAQSLVRQEKVGVEPKHVSRERRLEITCDVVLRGLSKSF